MQCIAVTVNQLKTSLAQPHVTYPKQENYITVPKAVKGVICNGLNDIGDG